MQVNGWTLYWHPAFRVKFENLVARVEGIRVSRPEDLPSNGHAKLLKRITEIISVEIPQDPDHTNYVQGNTLGKSYRNWRRAKFLKRFRLFFRFSSEKKAIIFAWMSDEDTLRKDGSKSDPYAVFTKCLEKGNPPNNWDALEKASAEIDSLPSL